MQLIYTDESGINYKLINEMFNDGPNLIYGAICVDDRKYFHLERLFLELINDFFGIDNWHKTEIHASDIWNQKGNFKNYKKEHISNFFEEIIQVLTKLHINTLISYYPKTQNANSQIQSDELKYSIYSLFHNIEMYLSEKNDTGILISDEQCVKDSDGNILFSKMFYDRTTWRTNPKNKTEFSFSSKFKYESMSCFMLDNIHYVDSRYSLFNQISDIMIYIFQRFLTYLHLVDLNPSLGDVNKVPVTLDSIEFYSEKLLKITTFDKEVNDVIFEDLTEWFYDNDEDLDEASK